MSAHPTFPSFVHGSSSFPLAAGAPRRRSSGALTLLLLGALTGCEKTPPPAAPTPATAKAPAAEAKPRSVTLLITGSTSGMLVPMGEGETVTGGAAELLGYWVAQEKHCPGQVKPDGQAACADATTLALATGDHWSGPAISSFFLGESTSQVMGQMGYAASALGNHELDFGREQFLKNRGLGGFPFLAANLKVKEPQLAKDMELPAFRIIERQGIKVGVVGLTSPKTVSTAMAGRAEGLELLGHEEALASAVPQAWKAGADVVVAVADVCPSELQPLVAKHPDWKLSLVAGGRCPQPVDAREGGTALVSLGRGLERYLRAHITVDPSKPARERVTAMETKMVEVVNSPQAPVNEELSKLIAQWLEKIQAVLGEEIGFTKKGLAQSSPQMARWVAGAVREVLGTDVAVLNRGGIRQDLPAGKVTRGSIYSVMPFENSLLIVKLKGAELLRQLANPQAIIAGATPAGKGKFKDATGKPIDPTREYTVATVEYLYFGGDGFEFEKLDPEPTETGMVWQTPVIDWTKHQGTTEAKPLEKVVR